MTWWWGSNFRWGDDEAITSSDMIGCSDDRMEMEKKERNVTFQNCSCVDSASHLLMCAVISTGNDIGRIGSSSGWVKLRKGKKTHHKPKEPAQVWNCTNTQTKHQTEWFFFEPSHYCLRWICLKSVITVKSYTWVIHQPKGQSHETVLIMKARKSTVQTTTTNGKCCKCKLHIFSVFN